MISLFREIDGVKNSIVVRYKKDAHSMKLSPWKYNFVCGNAAVMRYVKYILSDQFQQFFKENMPQQYQYNVVNHRKNYRLSMTCTIYLLKIKIHVIWDVDVMWKHTKFEFMSPLYRKNENKDDFASIKKYLKLNANLRGRSIYHHYQTL